MPTSEIKKVTIEHKWDDDSKTDYEIAKKNEDDLPSVMLMQGDDIIYLYTESWPSIRDQIDTFMESIEADS